MRAWPDFPVIVVHLADDVNPEVSACAGLPLLEERYEYDRYPRYLCPLCAYPDRRATVPKVMTVAVVPGTVRVVHE